MLLPDRARFSQTSTATRQCVLFVLFVLSHPHRKSGALKRPLTGLAKSNNIHWLRREGCQRRLKRHFFEQLVESGLPRYDSLCHVNRILESGLKETWDFANAGICAGQAVTQL